MHICMKWFTFRYYSETTVRLKGLKARRFAIGFAIAAGLETAFLDF